MSTQNNDNNFVALGHVIRAHGVHGALIIDLYSGDPQIVLTSRHLELISPDGVSVYLIKGLKGKMAAQGLIAKIEGLSQREEAMKFKGWTIGLKRSYLPKLDESEFYLTDLLGLSVYTKEAQFIGKVQQFMEIGPSLILQLIGNAENAKEILVPFNEEFLVELDLDGGRLYLDLPKGLLDI